jgi:glycosyltransferase involved in cell wall biosynthesis
MGFGMNKKNKIVWVCHFTNSFVQSKLPLWKKSQPFAAWIPSTLEGFEDSDEFELHIISPHQYLKKNTSFKEKNITYHFFKIGIPFLNRTWPIFFDLDLYTNYFFNKKEIKRLINKIEPDLINLQGAENPYYSSAALELYAKYPLLVTIQGFVSLEVDSGDTKHYKKRVEIEKEIINKCSYFGGDLDSKLVIESLKSDSFEYFNFLYPFGSNVKRFYLEEKAEKRNKEYDILFWSRITKGKGAEDFIKIVAALKQTFPQIKAQMIGGSSDEYINVLKKSANYLNCLENINFRGFVTNSDDLYGEVIKNKILVLPTYNDRLPTVLREAMQLGLPIVSYKTGSIPGINNKDEVILLSEVGDIDTIVKQITILLNEKKFFNDLIQKAMKYSEDEFGIKNNCAKMTNAYKNILLSK